MEQEVFKVPSYLMTRRNVWTTYTDESKNLLKLITNLTTNIFVYESATCVCL